MKPTAPTTDVPQDLAAIDFDRSGAAIFTEEAGPGLSYRELGRWVEQDRERLRRLGPRVPVFLFCPNSAAMIAAYLACLAERLPLALGEPAPLPRAKLCAAYRPAGLILPAEESPPAGYERLDELAGGGIVLWRTAVREAIELHPDLALLLTTSGSTGDAKLVRLSRKNLEANARSIAAYLGLKPGENAAQALPLHYSYGLSVLNSHLVAGGAITLTRHSFMRPEFWRVADQRGCTSFAGVPYMYETLHRLRWTPAKHPSVRTLTQAGGALRPELARHFQQEVARSGGRFFAMYGQTEATARMAYLPPERLAEKAGSIGQAIPGGELWTEPVPGEPGLAQLFFRGANVMLGYATSPADLARGDDLKGVLATGDLAEKDADGFFRITGRLARFAKLFGKRVDLGGIEAEVEGGFPVTAAARDGGDRIEVFVESAGGPADAEAIRARLVGLLGVPVPAVRIVPVERLPLTASGKKDYKRLG
ncbi:MAG TPA: AMP-binding protein [Opitutaceae bacterium]|nr:AMP-binding protein [Opitutaceae bacterium]